MKVETVKYDEKIAKEKAIAMFNAGVKKYYELKASLYTLCHSVGVEEKLLQEIDQELIKRLGLGDVKRRYDQIVDKTIYYKKIFTNHCIELSVNHLAHKVESEEGLHHLDCITIAKTASISREMLKFIEKNNK
ncbi:MAG: hypothetical protein OEZ01_04630 [Candidatus Heimdallarchaeota archaeon]|nr:hypothetical protein [Candidatus Heimdallarchaeota archaeon]